MKSKVFGLFMALMLLLSGSSWAQSTSQLKSLENDDFWTGDLNYSYSGGWHSEVCDPLVNGCVRYAKQSTGVFSTGGDIEIRKLVQPTAETGVFDVSIGVRGMEVVPNEPICAVIVFDRSSTMAGGKFTNARIGAVELLNLLHSQNPNNYLGFVSFHNSPVVEIELAQYDEQSIFSTGQIYDWTGKDDGTNIQWGLMSGHDQLMLQEGCNDLRKYVILISDGDPNVYYTSSEDECKRNGNGQISDCWKEKDGEIVFTCYGGSTYPVCTDKVSGDPFAKSYATGEAALLKADDYSTVYSIGYGANVAGKNLLKEIASSSNYYRDGDQDSIIQVFNSIAGEISSDTVEVGTNAKIEDTLNQVTLKSGNNTKTFAKITEGWQTFNFQVSLSPLAGTDWYKTNNGLTLLYTDAYDHSQTLSIAPNDTAEIYWEVPTVTVDFDPNGGTPDPDPIPVTPGGVIPPDDIPEDPILTGYHLTGWTIECNTDVFFDLENDVVTESMTLCAKWEPNTYQVKFDKNGGNGTMGNQTFTYNVSGNLNQNLYTKQGAIFNGWNTKQGGNGTSYSDKQEVRNLATTGTVTLYAQWLDNEVIVTFDPNGGTPTPNSKTVESGDNVPEPEDPVLTGYHLTGWTRTCDGNDFFNFASDVVTGDITLCAKWEPNEYTVIFDKNGGAGTMENQKFTYNVSGNLNQNSYTKQGAIFNGWNTKQGGNGTSYSDKQEVRNLATTGTVTLYAQWEPKKYTVNIGVNPDGYGTVSSGIIVVNHGATMSGSHPANGSLTIGGVTVTATPTPATAEYTYTFRGWTSNCRVPITDNCEVKAQFERTANPVTVIFDPNGGTPTPAPQIVDSGDSIDEPDDPILTGYHLTGWTRTCNGDDFFNFATDVVTGDITLCAKWEPNKYTIVYSGNGSTSGNMLNQTLTYDTTGSLNPNNFGKKGYTFKGWNTNPDGTGTPYQDQAKVRNLATTGTIELYAQWEPNRYTIKFDGNGATAGSMSGLEVEYDKDVTLTKNAYRKGSNTFLGWNTRADGKGTAYADEQSVRNLATEGEIVLYAQWSSGGSSGGGGSKSYACKNLPSNVEINNSLKPSGKDVDYYYSTDVSKPCTFQCKDGYVRNAQTERCEKVPDKPDDPTPVPPKPNCSIEGSTHSAEVNEAYIWACERGIIKSKTIQGARLGEFLNRAEMAKITTIFEMLEVGTMPDRTKDCSAFEASMSGYNSEMKNYMVTSCQLLRMGIHTADYTPIPDFMPRKFVSRAEFGTILSRILWGDKYEAEKNSRYYYVDHLYKLRDEGILTNIDPTLVERRSYAILMIYRAAKMLGKI